MGAKRHVEAQTQKIQMKEVFIDSLIKKCLVYNKCSKLRQPIVTHDWQHRWFDWRTNLKMPDVSHTCIINGHW